MTDLKPSLARPDAIAVHLDVHCPDCGQTLVNEEPSDMTLVQCEHCERHWWIRITISPDDE